MSQENLDLVTRAIRAAIRRSKPDFQTINVLFHPDHVLVSIMADKLGSEAAAVGASGYKDWLEAQEDVMSFETELRGAIDVGPDTVIAVTTIRVRGASSGATTDQRVWSVMTVTDGKIIRTENYIDPAEALEAVGLSEQATSHGNVGRLRRIHQEFFDCRRVRPELLAADVEWVNPSDAVEPGRRRGADSFNEAI